MHYDTSINWQVSPAQLLPNGASLALNLNGSANRGLPFLFHSVNYISYDPTFALNGTSYCLYSFSYCYIRVFYCILLGDDCDIK